MKNYLVRTAIRRILIRMTEITTRTKTRRSTVAKCEGFSAHEMDNDRNQRGKCCWMEIYSPFILTQAGRSSRA